MSLDNAQKTPIVKSLNDWLSEGLKAAEAIRGKSWPASVTKIDSTNTIVTVKFELTNIPYTLPEVTCPLAGPEFIRFPIGVGTKGFVVSAGAYLGGVSGLGGGTADLTPQPNLSTCVFYPIGNTGFSDTLDPLAAILGLGAPNGSMLVNKSGHTRIQVDDMGIRFYINESLAGTINENGLQFTFNGNSVLIDAAGVTVNGDVVGIQGQSAVGVQAPSVSVDGGGNTSIDGHNFDLHGHTGVATGGGTTGPVAP